MYLVTGANGFVGKAVVETFLAEGKTVVSVVRKLSNGAQSDVFNLHRYAIGNISYQTNWREVLRGVTAVVHCAARAHVVHEQGEDTMAAYRKVNLEGTLGLAEQAAMAGVRRFVFLSSIGVNGNTSLSPFTESDEPNPHNPYALSKLEAEVALLKLSLQTGMEVVIIRPPLVYGPFAPGNFSTLVNWVRSGLPLPLGSVNNRLSLVALDNLVSLISLCADITRSPQAANQVFVVCDGEDLSTSLLLHKLAQAAGRTSYMLAIPPWALRVGAALLGKRAVADRLLGNLQIDATKVRNHLGWKPVISLEEQLVKVFRNTKV